MVLPDDDSLKPALYQGLIEGFHVCGLQFDEILQLVDAGNLRVSGSSVNRTFFSLFPKLEDIVGNLIVGFLAVGLLEKLLLKLQQLLIDGIRGCGFSVKWAIDAFIRSLVAPQRTVASLLARRKAHTAASSR